MNMVSIFRPHGLEEVKQVSLTRLRVPHHPNDRTGTQPEMSR